MRLFFFSLKTCGPASAEQDKEFQRYWGWWRQSGPWRLRASSWRFEPQTGYGWRNHTGPTFRCCRSGSGYFFGNCSFRQWPSRCQQKIIYFAKFFSYFLKEHIHLNLSRSSQKGINVILIIMNACAYFSLYLNLGTPSCVWHFLICVTTKGV